jgi:hypothetical protein
LFRHWNFVIRHSFDGFEFRSFNFKSQISDCRFQISNPMPPTDPRISALTAELARLRNSTQQADDQLHALLLKLTEVQLNLATQDRTLARLDSSVNGNGKPGLLLRVDRIERLAGVLLKTVGLLTAAAITGIVKILFDRI